MPSDCPGTSNSGTLQGVPRSIVRDLWPAERLSMGMPVCRWLQEELFLRASGKFQAVPGCILWSLWPIERFWISLRVCKWLRSSMFFRATCIPVHIKERATKAETERVLPLLCKFRHPALKILLKMDSSRLEILNSLFAEPHRAMRHHLTLVDLDGFRMGPVLDVLLGCSRLEHLCLTDCEDGDGDEDCGSQKLASVLRECAQLRHLDLSENTNLGDIGFQSLAAAIPQLTMLTHVNLGSNSKVMRGNITAGFGSILTAAGICPVLKALQGRNLTHLDLHSTCEDPATVEDLVAVLRQCSALTFINISSTPIGPGFRLRQGSNPSRASDLCESLSRCGALATVDMSSCQLGDTGAAMLASALTSSTALTRLELAMNGISQSGARQLLERCRSLQELDLQANLLPADDRLALQREWPHTEIALDFQIGTRRHWYLDEESVAVVHG